MLDGLREPLAIVIGRATRYVPEQRFADALELGRWLHTAGERLGG